MANPLEGTVQVFCTCCFSPGEDSNNSGHEKLCLLECDILYSLIDKLMLLENDPLKVIAHYCDPVTSFHLLFVHPDPTFCLFSSADLCFFFPSFCDPCINSI
jgi:hypothetical protein